MRNVDRLIFKGWDESTMSWAYGGGITVEDNTYIVKPRINMLEAKVETKYIKIAPESLCQYTGLEDSLETEIFSNDIIAVDNKTYIGVVKKGVYNTDWDSKAGHCGFYVEWQNRSGLRKDLGFWVNQRDIAVIGNVFDGKDLLEG